MKHPLFACGLALCGAAFVARGAGGPTFLPSGPGSARLCLPAAAVDRVVDVITSTPQPSGTPGVNLYNIRGYALTNGTPSLAIQSQTGVYGTFAVTNGWLAYHPGVIGNAVRLDPAAGTYYDRAEVVLTDGVFSRRT